MSRLDRRKDTALHPLLTPAVVSLFQGLELGLTVFHEGRWLDVYRKPYALDLLGFELEHGVEAERVSYNNERIEQARRTRKTVVGCHAGLTDLFVPVPAPARGAAPDVLVTGPLQTARPSAQEALARWRALTGTLGQATQAEFAHYVTTTLSTLVLAGPHLEQFTELVERLAGLAAGCGDAEVEFAKITEIGRKLGAARRVERMWEVARAMVDERTSRTWASPHRAFYLGELGVTSYPEHVVVCLFVERAATVEYADRTEGGPAERREVERLVRRDAFQRAFAELARKLDSSVCGQVGSYGVSLLAPSVGSAGSARRRLGALVEEAHGLARRGFGLSLHAGVSVLPLPLPQQFRAALGAAEAALGKGSRLVEATSDQRRTGGSGALRKELLDLAELLDREPASLPARFERYLEVVAARSAHRVELARAYLEVGGEQLGEAFRASGALDDAHFESTMSQLEASAECAASLPELFAAYRSAISSFANALNDPTRSRRDHGLRRADEYLSSHFQKPISLAKVARTAGFAPSYFSALFRKQHGITFERYLANLRIKRARQLLSGTDLNLQRVAELSGFSTRHYLGRVFKRCTGETPLSYRERVRRERKGPLSEP